MNWSRMGEPGTGSAGWTLTTGYRVDRSSAPNSIGSIRTSSAGAKTSGPINHERHRHRATTHHAIDVNATSSSADQSYALKADRRSSSRPQRKALRTWRRRAEEHTYELQTLMRISYDVFC